MKRIVFFLVAAFGAMPCAAQQAKDEPAVVYEDQLPPDRRTHLVPTESVHDLALSNFEYPKIIATVFREAYAEDVLARVYLTAGGPGPLLSDMLFLKKTATDYRFVYLHPLVPLLDYLPRPNLLPSGRAWPQNVPADYHDLKPWRCEKPISLALGERVVELWKKVLLETRYATKHERGFDGADYLFSMEVNYEDVDQRQYLTGTIWSPDGRTKPGMLVNIVGSLSAQCLPELYGSEEPLETLVEKLEKEFAKAP